jgi:2'-5' RNA ligase
MRLFIGIPLAEAAIEALDRVSQSLRSAGDSLRWSSPESWHITLQFLGDSSAEKYACLVSRLARISYPPVLVRLAGLGSFDRAGVFFAAVDVSVELRELQNRVTGGTRECGFVAEDRPFHPHVTLARAKGENRTQSLRQLKARGLPKAETLPFTASEFVLYEAFLGPGGSRYEIRARFPLIENKV